MLVTSFNYDTYIKKLSGIKGLILPENIDAKAYEKLCLYKHREDIYILHDQMLMDIMLKGISAEKYHYHTEEGKKTVLEIRRILRETYSIDVDSKRRIQLPKSFVNIIGDEREVLIKGLGKSLLLTHPLNDDLDLPDQIEVLMELADKASDEIKKR